MAWIMTVCLCSLTIALQNQQPTPSERDAMQQEITALKNEVTELKSHWEHQAKKQTGMMTQADFKDGLRENQKYYFNLLLSIFSGVLAFLAVVTSVVFWLVQRQTKQSLDTRIMDFKNELDDIKQDNETSLSNKADELRDRISNDVETAHHLNKTKTKISVLVTLSSWYYSGYEFSKKESEKAETPSDRENWENLYHQNLSLAIMASRNATRLLRQIPTSEKDAHVRVKNNLAYHLAERGNKDDKDEALDAAYEVYSLTDPGEKDWFRLHETYPFVLCQLCGEESRNQAKEIVSKLLTSKIPEDWRLKTREKYRAYFPYL